MNNINKYEQEDDDTHRMDTMNNTGTAWYDG